jgi:hypothetical protein
LWARREAHQVADKREPKQEEETWETKALRQWPLQQGQVNDREILRMDEVLQEDHNQVRQASLLESSNEETATPLLRSSSMFIQDQLEATPQS